MRGNMCWVVERHDLPSDGGNAPFRYLSWDAICDEPGLVWVGYWERALKFFDRASAEMLCAEMPFEWDVKIKEHQVG